MIPRPKHLFTDASCVLGRGIGGWAAMLIDGMESELRSGVIGGVISNGTSAEISAVRYALRNFIRAGRIGRHDTIIVHCDNQGVCLHLMGRAILPREQVFRDELERIARTCEQHQIAVVARWIKGHQGLLTTDWRALINTRVDQEARTVTKAENRRRIALGDTGRMKKRKAA